MAPRISWTSEAKSSLRKLLTYLKTNHGRAYAESVLEAYMDEIEGVADHPSKGMVIDRSRMLRPWKLDRHNYVTYLITEGGIQVHDILPYRLNKRGF